MYVSKLLYKFQDYPQKYNKFVAYSVTLKAFQEMSNEFKEFEECMYNIQR
jgi:hypothetical protein